MTGLGGPEHGATEAPLLELEAVDAGYASGQVLFALSLTVEAGEAVTLLGRNGMGKTTTINTIMGHLRPRAGTLRFAGRAIGRAPPHEIARLGIGLVPEGRRIFGNLTVRENLIATARAGDAGRSWDLDRVFALFPILRERSRQPGSRLSGGEAQLLAIGRALMTNPRLLIMDEATEGLAPNLRAQIWRVVEKLKALGHAILLVDKDLRALRRFADRHYVLEKGRIVWQGRGGELDAAPTVVERYLGV